MRSALRAAAILAMVVGLPACGDDGGPAGTVQDFSGVYSIVSFAQGSPPTPIAGASGTITLTATNYTFSVTVPPLTLTDAGTYTATGTATSGTWTQQSTDDPNLQATGTYAVDAATGRLTIDTTVQGIRNVIVMQKT